MSLVKVSKDKLKESVQKSAPQLAEDVVFIAGARAIKNGQIEVEFVQCRPLAGRKVSLKGLLNEGDNRFSTGKTVMRVWTMVSVLGFKNLFPEVHEAVDFDAVAEACQGLEKDERIALLQKVQTIDVQGVKHPIKIVCKETIDINELPKSIREQLLDDEIEDSIKERYMLQTGGDKSQKIVDKNGNTIYRTFDLSYGEDTDVLVADKVLESEFKNRKANKTNTKDDVLAKMQSELVG